MITARRNGAHKLSRTRLQAPHAPLSQMLVRNSCTALGQRLPSSMLEQ